MKFEIAYHSSLVVGTPIYRLSEHSMDFNPLQTLNDLKTNGIIDITLVSTLQLACSVKYHTLLYAWGYHPTYKKWRRSSLPYLNTITGGVRLKGVTNPTPGVSLLYEKSKDWETVIDSNTGWIYIGPSNIVVPESAVLFATDSVAGITNSNLVSFWIKPNMI